MHRFLRMVRVALRRLLWSRSTLAVLLSLMLSAMILIGGVLAYYSMLMPDIAGLAAAKEQAGVEIVGERGVVVARYGEITGRYIPYEQLPPTLVQAVLATEDRRFFDHHGVDWLGIIRAMLTNIRQGRVVQGGSSITQQLAKNVFLSSERSMERKLKELLVAFWLERTFSKQEILAIYLNRVYFGAGNYGVDAAAQFYFNKPVQEIDIVESAMLAGLLKAPSRYNPTADMNLTVGRTTQVLRNMAHAEFITEAQAETHIAALASKEKFFTRPTFGSDRYYADWIYDQLPQYLETIEDDIIVTTSYNSRAQDALQQAVQDVLTPQIRKKRNASQVGGLMMTPQGAVQAMVGGIDYNSSQYNRAVQAKRQPGSAFKLFVYLAAMEKGYMPDMVLLDEPVMVGTWQPGNYSRTYRGAITLTEALAHSVNTIAVKLSQYIGIDTVRRTAKRLGIQSPLEAVPSLALGTAEVSLKEIVTAYAHLANAGRAVAPYGITRITRKKDGKILYQRSNHDYYKEIVVVQPETIAKMNHLLQTVMMDGTARGAQIGRPAAGKTGTTSDYKDAWFVGYTPHMVAGIWVGNDDATRMAKVTGGSLPARIWKQAMQKVHEGIRVASLPTDYGQHAQPLPWLQAQQTPYLAPDTTGDAPFQLERGFWDKLFGDPASPTAR